MSAQKPQHEAPSTVPGSEHEDHGSGHHGPAPPDESELKASAAVRDAVAGVVGRPLGAALSIAGAGWSLATIGQGQVILLPLAALTCAYGLALLSVSQDSGRG